MWVGVLMWGVSVDVGGGVGVGCGCWCKGMIYKGYGWKSNSV